MQGSLEHLKSGLLSSLIVTSITYVDSHQGEYADEDLDGKRHDLTTQRDHAPLIPLRDGLIGQNANHIFVLLKEVSGDDDVTD